MNRLLFLKAAVASVFAPSVLKVALESAATVEVYNIPLEDLWIGPPRSSKRTFTDGYEYYTVEYTNRFVGRPNRSGCLTGITE
ncbi:MAG: hypothetical protein KAJ55_00245 [Anaerolineales bacterium]|nr:hypothetical protein [Anaerolineales bacterium]